MIDYLKPHQPEDKAWETEESAYTVFGSDNQMEILIS